MVILDPLIDRLLMNPMLAEIGRIVQLAVFSSLDFPSLLVASDLVVNLLLLVILGRVRYLALWFFVG